MEYETDLTYTFPSEDGREEKPQDPDPDRNEPLDDYPPEPYHFQDDRDIGGGWDDDYPTHFERVKDAGYEAGDPKGYSVL